MRCMRPTIGSHRLDCDLSINTLEQVDKILLGVKPNYEVEICFRIQDEVGVDVTTFLHKKCFKYEIAEQSKRGRCSQYCTQTSDCKRMQIVQSSLPFEVELSDYMYGLRLRGNRFECDIDAVMLTNVVRLPMYSR